MKTKWSVIAYMAGQSTRVIHSADLTHFVSAPQPLLPFRTWFSASSPRPCSGTPQTCDYATPSSSIHALPRRETRSRCPAAGNRQSSIDRSALCWAARDGGTSGTCGWPGTVARRRRWPRRCPGAAQRAARKRRPDPSGSPRPASRFVWRRAASGCPRPCARCGQPPGRWVHGTGTGAGPWRSLTPCRSGAPPRGPRGCHFGGGTGTRRLRWWRRSAETDRRKTWACLSPDTEEADTQTLAGLAETQRGCHLGPGNVSTDRHCHRRWDWNQVKLMPIPWGSIDAGVSAFRLVPGLSSAFDLCPGNLRGGVYP